MAKNSTLLSNVSFIASGEKNLKEKPLQDDQFSPSDAIITGILNFSKVLRVEKSRQAGLIEIVLN